MFLLNRPSQTPKSKKVILAMHHGNSLSCVIILSPEADACSSNNSVPHLLVHPFQRQHTINQLLLLWFNHWSQWFTHCEPINPSVSHPPLSLHGPNQTSAHITTHPTGRCVERRSPPSRPIMYVDHMTSILKADGKMQSESNANVARYDVRDLVIR